MNFSKYEVEDISTEKTSKNIMEGVKIEENIKEERRWMLRGRLVDFVNIKDLLLLPLLFFTSFPLSSPHLPLYTLLPLTPYYSSFSF